MKILQLCHKPPFPAKDGGCLAMHCISEGLMGYGHEVRILSIATAKHPLETGKMDADYLKKTRVEGVFVDTRVNLVDAFSSLITQDSYNISRFFSPDFDRRLTQILKREKFDVVHVESLFMTPYLGTVRRHSKAKIVLRSHNLEHVIWERMARGTRNLARKAYLKYLARKLKEYELDVFAQVDGIAAISSEDGRKYKKFGYKGPLISIPFGIDLDGYKPASTAPELALFHLGAMDWTPNLEGIIWFLEEVWPKIHQKYPELPFYLAGRNMPEDLGAMAYPNVVVLGEIEDAKAFMNSKSIMIVPLLSAGGIRVKIIEGMALEKAIITTSVGAEGIEYTAGEHLLLASNARQFTEAVDKLMANPGLIREIGIKARERASSHYDNKQLITRLISFYESLLKG